MSSTDAATRLTGRVKWFNNKDGFGFINVCEEGEHSSKDIFVHWNSLDVEKSQYKYLVQGEYVEFSLAKPEKGTHEFHAVGVRGLKGGPLMCETRRTNMQQRVRNGDVAAQTPTSERSPRRRQQSRGDAGDATDFTTVKRRTNKPHRNATSSA